MAIHPLVTAPEMLAHLARSGEAYDGRQMSCRRRPPAARRTPSAASDRGRRAGEPAAGFGHMAHSKID